MPPKYSKHSPDRPVKRPIADGSLQKPVLSSFQRNEALVYTDESNKFPEWPADAGPHIPSQVAFNHTAHMTSIASTTKLHGPLRSESPSFPLADGGGQIAADPPVAVSVAPPRAPVNTANLANQQKFSALKQQSKQKLFSLKSKSDALTNIASKNASVVGKQRTVQTKSLPDKSAPELVQSANESAVYSSNVLGSESTDHSGDSATLRQQQQSSLEQQTSELNFSVDPMDLFLKKAEELLADVKIAVKTSSRGSMSSKMAESATISMNGAAMLSHLQALPSASNPLSLVAMPPTGAIGRFEDVQVKSQYSSQIEWLIRGVPEALEDLDDPQIDDLVVDRLLSEGGQAPSQLVFPSLYAANQRVMTRLRHCKRMRLNISHLSIFSARYGVRRESSFLVIKLPLLGVSTKIDLSSSYSIVPLPELKETIAQGMVADNIERRKEGENVKRGPKVGSGAGHSLREFFVGSVSLSKSLDFTLHLSDDVACEWFRGNNDKGVLRIELHSYLYPTDIIVRKREIFKAMDRVLDKCYEPVCFGVVEIPMSGVLASEALDSTAACQLNADAATLATMINKINALPNGVQILRANPLTTQMGSITTRITLFNDGGYEPIFDHAEIKGGVTKRDEFIIVAEERERDEEEARMAVPVDYIAMAAENRLKKQFERSRRSFEEYKSNPLSLVGPMSSDAFQHISPTLDNVFLALLFYRLDFTQSFLKSPVFGKASSKVAVELNYKVSARVHDGITGQLSRSSNSVNFMATKVYPMSKKKCLLPPVVEVWMDLLDGDRKQLVGLAKIDQSSLFGETLTANVVNMNTFDDLGSLSLALCMHDSMDNVSQLAVKTMATAKIHLEHCEGNNVRSSSVLEASPTAEHPEIHTQDRQVELDELEFEAPSLLFEEPRSKDMLPMPQAIAQRSPETSQDHSNSIINYTHIETAVQDDQRGNSYISESSSDASNVELDMDNEQNHIFFLTSPAKIKSGGGTSYENNVSPSADARHSATSPLEEGGAGFAIDENDNGMDSWPPKEVPTLAMRPALHPSISNQERFISGIHNIEILVEGSCSCNPVTADHSLAANMQLGAFITYQFPNDLNPDRSKIAYINDGIDHQCESFYLWWDSDCEILNGRNVHRFELLSSDGGSDELQFISRQLGISGEQGLEFHLVHDGGIDASTSFSGKTFDLPASNVFAKATIPLIDLAHLLSHSVGSSSKRFQLPLSYTAGYQGRATFLSVSISHRLEPKMLSNSLNSEITSLALLGAPPSENHKKAPEEQAAMMQKASTGERSLESISVSIEIIEVSRLKLLKGILPSEQLRPTSLGQPKLFWTGVASSGIDLVSDGGSLGTKMDHLLHAPAFDSFTSSPRSITPDECDAGALGQLSLKWNESFTCSIHVTNRVDKQSNTLKNLKNAAVTLNLFARQHWIGPDVVPPSASNILQLGDHLLGTVIVDLTMLAYNVPFVEGWYYLIDNLQHDQGVIKVKITPIQNVPASSAGQSLIVSSQQSIDLSQSRNNDQFENFDYQSHQSKSSTANPAISSFSDLDVKNEDVSLEALRRKLSELEEIQRAMIAHDGDSDRELALQLPYQSSSVKQSDDISEQCATQKEERDSRDFNEEEIDRFVVESQLKPQYSIEPVADGEESPITASRVQNPDFLRSSTESNILRGLSVLDDHDWDTVAAEASIHPNFSVPALATTSQLQVPLMNSIEDTVVYGDIPGRESDDDASAANDFTGIASMVTNSDNIDASLGDVSGAEMPSRPLLSLTTTNLPSQTFQSSESLLGSTESSNEVDYSQTFDDMENDLVSMGSLGDSHGRLSVGDITGFSSPNNSSPFKSYQTGFDGERDQNDTDDEDYDFQKRQLPSPAAGQMVPHFDDRSESSGGQRYSDDNFSDINTSGNDELEHYVERLAPADTTHSESSMSPAEEISTDEEVRLHLSGLNEVNNALPEADCLLASEPSVYSLASQTSDISSLVAGQCSNESHLSALVHDFEPESQQDTPETAKIKRIANEEIDRRLVNDQPTVPPSPQIVESQLNYSDVQMATNSAQVEVQTGIASKEDKRSPPQNNLGIAQLPSLCDEAVDIQIKPVITSSIDLGSQHYQNPNQNPMRQSRSIIPELTRIAELIPSLIPPPTFNGRLMTRFPNSENVNTTSSDSGRSLSQQISQRMFVDAETERVSKIMLGKLSRVAQSPQPR